MYLLIFGISVAWEVMEHIMFKAVCKFDTFFCGRYEDVVFNMLGYIIGSALALNVNTK
jgi:hypothetical protein